MFKEFRAVRTYLVQEFALASIDLNSIDKLDEIFIYDNFGPDGPRVLREFNKQKLVHEFGPPKDRYYSLFLVFLIRKFITPNFLKQKKMDLSNLCQKNIFVGSSENSILKYINYEKNRIHELQHGCLDQSYFDTVRAPHVFFARDKISKEIYTKYRCGTEVIIKSEKVSSLDDNYNKTDEFTGIRLYSKNPGGKCSAASVRELERFLLRYCLINQINLSIYAHPRDRFIKYIFRNKNLFKAAIIAYANSCIYRKNESDLVISSYSTALFDQAKNISQVINVNFNEHDEIQELVYSKLPSCNFTELKEQLVKLPIQRKSHL